MDDHNGFIVSPTPAPALPSQRRITIAYLLALAGAACAIAAPIDEPGLHQSPDSTYTLPTPTTLPRPDAIRPSTPASPSADLDGQAIAGGMLAEGSFITGARGRPVRGKSGAWYVVFDPDQRGPGGQPIPAMVLAPHPNLAAVERLASRLLPEQRVLFSGQVFVYGGVNHLLETTPPIVEQAPGAQEEKTTKPDAAPATGEKHPGAPIESKPAANKPEPGDKPAPTGAEPTIEQIIEQLDRAVGTSRRVDLPKITGTDAADANGSPASLVPGGYLTARRGRVVRGNDGSPTFVFDSGASNGGTSTDGPMILLPCQNLTRMENVAAIQGEKATFTVSGEAVVYRGKNYLLPRMFVVNRKTDVVASGQ